MSQTTTPNSILRLILSLTLGFGILMFLGSFYYLKMPLVAGGVIAGCILGMANLVFLTKIVVKILDQDYKRKPVIALYFIVKLVFIVAVLGLSFWHFNFDPKGFAAGYFCLIFAIILGQLFGPQMSVSLTTDDHSTSNL